MLEIFGEADRARPNEEVAVQQLQEVFCMWSARRSGTLYTD